MTVRHGVQYVLWRSKSTTTMAWLGLLKWKRSRKVLSVGYDISHAGASSRLFAIW